MNWSTSTGCIQWTEVQVQVLNNEVLDPSAGAGAGAVHLQLFLFGTGQVESKRGNTSKTVTWCVQHDPGWTRDSGTARWRGSRARAATVSYFLFHKNFSVLKLLNIGQRAFSTTMPKLRNKLSVAVKSSETISTLCKNWRFIYVKLHCHRKPSFVIMPNDYCMMRLLMTSYDMMSLTVPHHNLFFFCHWVLSHTGLSAHKIISSFNVKVFSEQINN